MTDSLSKIEPSKAGEALSVSNKELKNFLDEMSFLSLSPSAEAMSLDWDDYNSKDGNDKEKEVGGIPADLKRPREESASSRRDRSLLLQRPAPSLPRVICTFSARINSFFSLSTYSGPDSRKNSLARDARICEGDSRATISLSPLHKIMELDVSQAQASDILAANTARCLWGRTPLHLAVARGAPLGVVKDLLQRNKLFTWAQDIDGMCPLHLSVKMIDDTKERIDAFHALMGQDPGVALVQDKFGRKPLHWAVKSGAESSVIKRLFYANKGAATDRDFSGRTPLHYIEESGISLDSIGVIVVGCNPYQVMKNPILLTRIVPTIAKARDPEGATVLHCLCRRIRQRVQDRRELQIFLLILERFVDKYPAAITMGDITGASPVGLLVAQCCSHAAAPLIEPELCCSLRMMMPAMQNAHPVAQLCRLNTPCQLTSFFLLFSEAPTDFTIRSLPKEMTIDWTREKIPGWTFLEVLADIDSEDSASIFVQIISRLDFRKVEHQKLHLAITWSEAARTTITLISMCSGLATLNRVLKRVSDRACLSRRTEVQAWGEKLLEEMRRRKEQRLGKISSKLVRCIDRIQNTLEANDGRSRLGSSSVSSFSTSRMSFSTLDETSARGGSIFHCAEIPQIRKPERKKSYSVELTTTDAGRDSMTWDNLEFIKVRNANRKHSLSDSLSHTATTQEATETTMYSRSSESMQESSENFACIPLYVSQRNSSPSSSDANATSPTCGNDDVLEKPVLTKRAACASTTSSKEVPAKAVPNPKKYKVRVSGTVDLAYRHEANLQNMAADGKLQFLLKIYDDVNQNYKYNKDLTEGARTLYFRSRKIAKCFHTCCGGDVETFLKANPTFSCAKYKCPFLDKRCSNVTCKT